MQYWTLHVSWTWDCLIDDKRWKQAKNTVPTSKYHSSQLNHNHVATDVWMVAESEFAKLPLEERRLWHRCVRPPVLSARHGGAWHRRALVHEGKIPVVEHSL